MRRRFLTLLAPILFVGVFAAPAVEAEPVDGVWQCLWTHPAANSLFQCNLVLVVLPNGAVEGRIEWTVLRVERDSYRDKIGLVATEFVRGTFDERKGVLNLRGYDKDDPRQIIGPLVEAPRRPAR